MRPLTTPPNLGHRFWKKFSLATLSGLMLLLLLLPTLLTQLIRYQIPRMGFGVIEIGNIDINLFRGRVLLEEVALYKSAARVFYLERAEVDLSILSLLEQRIHLQSLTIQGLSLTLKKYTNQPLQIAGVALPQAAAGSNESAISEEASAWTFGIDAMSLSDGSLLVLHPQFSETIQLNSFSVGPLAMWRPEFVTPVSLGVALGEGTIRVMAKSKPFAAEPVHRIELTIKSLPLDNFAKLTEPVISGLQGTLSSQMQLQLQQDATQPLALSQKGELSLIGLQLHTGNHLLAQDGLHWKGSLNLTDVTKFETVRVNGALKLSGIHVNENGNKAPVASLHDLSLQMQLQLQQNAAEQLVINQKGELSLTGLQLQTGNHRLTQDNLHWKGSLNLTDVTKFEIFQMNGALKLSGVSVNESGNKAPVASLHDLSLQMQLLLQQNAAEQLAISQKGELSLTGLQLQIDNHRLTQDELHWDGSLNLTDIAKFETLQVNGALNLAGINLSETGKKAPAVSLHGLSLTGLQLEGSTQLTLADVAVDSLVAEVVRRRSGVALVGMPAAPSAKEEAMVGEKAATAVEEEPFKLRIERVRLSGENRFTFDDQTVKPPFRHTITITEGELQHIDTSRPNQLTTVMIKGKDNYYTKFSVNGNTKPFAPQLAFDLKAKLNNFDMPPTSPYLAQLLGYRITTGQVDSDVTMQVENNVMKGEVDLRMNQLQLEPEDPARIEEFQSKSTLPLNTALSLLRDSNDNIKLKLPISGKLDDPQFDINDIINTALGKSLKMASVSYLKMLLQPYGSLITIIQMAGKAAGHIQLDPVKFAAGSAELSAETTPYIEKISKLLEKKNINMQLCGFATVADLTALTKGKEKVIPPAGHPALEALAKQRAESIKLVLVNTHGVSPKQLFICHPELDSNENAAARVEISI